MGRHDNDFDSMNDTDSWIRHIEPLTRSDVREFIGNGVNMHPYWFEALKWLKNAWKKNIQ